MFEASRRASVLQLRAAGMYCLSTTFDGGYRRADAIYAATVPSGWNRTDLAAYAAERRQSAGFEESGPTLLTGVDLEHARLASADEVVVCATAGISNPAALPMEESAATTRRTDERPPPGTVNLVVGTTRALTDGGLATLLGVAVEAKAATLLAETGFPGTTSDAVIVACQPDGKPATFAGSATPVGDAARACVRDAVRASLASRYPNGAYPASVAAAEYGVITDRVTTVNPIPHDK